MTSDNCPYTAICGGCTQRDAGEETYRRQKTATVQKILQGLTEKSYVFEEPTFIPDGCRRRATMAFARQKGNVILGFNALHSNDISDISHCRLLTERINRCLPEIAALIKEIIAIPRQKRRGKKIIRDDILSGDVAILDADNGIDLVLEIKGELNLEQKTAIFERGQASRDIIRISQRQEAFGRPEPLLEKSKPVLNIGGFELFVPAGSFLQATKAGEQKLIELTLRYLGETRGKIADLFCGAGTFSYPLAADKNNKILAADASAELLNAFQASVNKNRISNIQIINRNLFKYPLQEEIAGFDAVIFDPPRAGAAEQCTRIAALPSEKKPRKIIAVSCNPHSFVKDANILIDGGYHLERLTLVDQFTYSKHSELAALFTKETEAAIVGTEEF